MKGLAVLAQTFAQIDVNGSGTLDFGEFANSIAQNLDATDEEVIALFKFLDKDGNGVVDYDEFV